jgi:coenzyme F420 hydrogenase subunit beta
MDLQQTSEHRPALPWSPPLADPKPRSLCTDCGLSRTSEAKLCGSVCQFIKPDYAGLEQQVHGRLRKTEGDERFFGPVRQMWRASLKQPRAGAQWTGITTRLAERLLETGRVTAVLCVAPDPNDRWKPLPVIITRAEDMAQCRGMRMGFAPLLALLKPAAEAGHKRIALIGVPCQVHALRALERQFGFERIDIIGTPCSDNTTTANFHAFLARLSDQPETIAYLEFRADYHVEIRFDDGRRREIPFLDLPLSDLPADFFPMTCRTCVDYTNTLADITIGYMGGEGEQWLLVRNGRGEEMLALIADELQLSAPGSAGKRAGAVKGFLKNTELAAGGLPIRRMPRWIKPLVSWLMPRVGPRGLEFARARVEMKAVETVLHLRRAHPKRMKSMIPAHIWALAASYGLVRRNDE